MNRRVVAPHDGYILYILLLERIFVFYYDSIMNYNKTILVSRRQRSRAPLLGIYMSNVKIILSYLLYIGLIIDTIY